MGAHCCASEAANGARRERAAEAITDGRIQVETSDSLEPAAKPLWLLEHEEALAAAQRGSLPSTAAPPPAPPAAPPAAEGRPEAAAAGRRTVGRGKALARSQARQESGGPAAEAPGGGGPLGAKRLSTVSPSGTPQGGILHHVVKISLQGAKDLCNRDLVPGKSDPYCICEIPGKPSSKFKTKVVKDSLDPFWYRVVELSGFANTDTLRFSVFDKDTLTADDCLGQATLSREDAVKGGGFKGELTLKRDIEKAQSPEAGRLEVSVELVRSYYMSGKVKPQITEINDHATVNVEDLREITVNIYSAKNLRNADWGPGQGVSDPYCICEVPGKAETRIRTQVCKNTLNPTWDFTGTIRGYCKGDPLLFTVLDKDVLKADDFLGRATIAGAGLFDVFQGELKLDKDASIRVKVEVSEPSTGEQAAAAQGAEPPPSQEANADRLKTESQQSEEDPAAMSAALLQAADSGDAKTFRRLLAAGVSFEATDAQGMSVLHICVMRRNEDFVSRLLKKKGRRALLLMRTRDKDTALHMAARDDLKVICGMLVKEGANARSKNAAGQTPADLASGDLAEWLRS